VLIGQVIARNTDIKYFLSEQLFSFEPFALAIPRGDADFEHVANSALAQIHRSGRIDEIYRSWFGRFAENPPDLVLAIFQLGAIPE
jgi:ABC-type amino acid transport substrate-binding protein